MINRVISEDPLQMAHVKQLHPHTSHYVIPKNQKYLKMFGVVIYMTEMRAGAEEEANGISTALKEAGFTVVERKWQSGTRLESILKQILLEYASQSSVFLLCLMSHGNAGILRGPDDEKTNLNDLLLIATYYLPPKVPLVSMNHQLV